MPARRRLGKLVGVTAQLQELGDASPIGVCV
jgi:hypothetical protein